MYKRNVFFIELAHAVTKKPFLPLLMPVYTIGKRIFPPDVGVLFNPITIVDNSMHTNIPS